MTFDLHNNSNIVRRPSFLFFAEYDFVAFCCLEVRLKNKITNPSLLDKGHIRKIVLALIFFIKKGEIVHEDMWTVVNWDCLVRQTLFFLCLYKYKYNSPHCDARKLILTPSESKK